MQVGYTYRADHPDRIRKIECMKTLLLRYKGPRPTGALEPFGGVGTITQLIRAKWKGLRPHRVADIDKECCDELKLLMFHQPSVKVSQCDFTEKDQRDEMTRRFPEGGFISLDFSHWTALSLLRPEIIQLMHAVVDLRPRIIQLTDCSVSKLHLNANSYTRVFGRPTPNYDTYMEALNQTLNIRFGYTITDHQRHVRATYIFMEPSI